jgi:hypothetical protein
LPWQFFGALVLLTIAYLVLVEVTKKAFYADTVGLIGQPQRVRGREHRIQRRAARFSHGRIRLETKPAQASLRQRWSVSGGRAPTAVVH